MASLTELSFNWIGFVSAMISNIAFTYRSIYSKKAMVRSRKWNLHSFTIFFLYLFEINFLSCRQEWTVQTCMHTPQ